MRRTALAAAALCALAFLIVVDAAIAAAPADTSVHVGTTLNDLLLAYAGVIGTIVSAIAAWALSRFMGIKLDQEARSAIETFTNNAAGGFLVKFDTLKGVNVDIHNADIAALANAGMTRIPDALKRFGLTADELKKRIVEKVGIMTAADTTTAALPTPKPPLVM